jgi:hypothetical protein
MHGTCHSNKCVCDEGFNGTACEQVLQLVTHLYSIRCPQHCSEHGNCHLGRCICDLGYTGIACETQVKLACTDDCNGKGICEYGICHCDSDYGGPNCETKLRCSVDCASAKQGVCVAGRCVCLNGYTGIDCSHAPANEVIGQTLAPSFANTANKARFSSVESEESVHAASTAHLYILPIHPAVLGVASFIFGVVVAFIIKYSYDKYRQRQTITQTFLKAKQ